MRIALIGAPRVRTQYALNNGMFSNATGESRVRDIQCMWARILMIVVEIVRPLVAKTADWISTAFASATNFTSPAAWRLEANSRVHAISATRRAATSDDRLG